MPDLAYFNVVEDDGQVRSLTGSFSIEINNTSSVDLSKATEALEEATQFTFQVRARRSQSGKYRNMIRAVTRTGSTHSASVADQLSDASLSVLYSALNEPEESAGTHRDFHYYIWNALTHRVKRLASDELQESFGAWLRLATEADSTLVEVANADHDTLRAMLGKMVVVYGDRALTKHRSPPPRYFGGLIGRSAPPSVTEDAEALPVAATAARLPLAERRESYRNTLMQPWLTSDVVSARLGSTAQNGSKLTSELRRENKLLGAWSSTERAYRYPDWQFGPDGTPLPGLAEVLAILDQFPLTQGLTQQARKESGWREVEWFLVARVELDGLTPSVALAQNPEKVLAIATADLEEARDPNARW